MRKLVVYTLILLITEYSGVILTVIADLVSGLRKARREGRLLTSCGFRRTVRKLVSYFLALFSLSVVDAMIITAIIVYSMNGSDIPLSPFPFLTTFGAIALAMIEIKSICENSPHRSLFSQAFELLKKLSCLRKQR